MHISKTKSHRRPRVVTIGGGTGSFVLLSGLKRYLLNISAIVSMADDGGSTGELRDEMGVLPPGDVRQCLAALARAAPEVRDLFNYRFSNGDLRGHNAGNLFLSALEKITGSFPRAIAVAGKILNVYGRVIPVTEGDMRLLVELKDGTVLQGENKLDDNERVRELGVRAVSLSRPVAAYDDAVRAILKADVVVIGPGDLYGSTIPNLLVSGLPGALRDTKAQIIVVANVTNKKGLTEGFSSGDYVRIVEGYLLGRKADVLVCNTEKPDTHLAQRYEEQEGVEMFVACDHGTEYRVVHGEFLHHEVNEEAGDTLAHTRSFIRHDSDKLARAIVECI
ncbi:hypothetical protein CL652_00430 [bacterium]|nr:hypothetical protein [bacterium]|tara:strand:- start:5138 stop:6142 length:1005 start_codon:yes stop_codon:yes gene_type:complete